jgi:HPr kinase/phosphorylase
MLGTPLPAARIIEFLRVYLTKAIAKTCSMHGVLMDVLGMGVLISGESGLGKSELALELISRGHGLVADDVVELARIAPHAIEGRCPPLLRDLLEVRGLGLLDIRTIFGETAVRRKMTLKLIVHLVRRSTMDDAYQRLPLEALTEDVLGLAIPKVVIPVAAGRNLAVLTEAAVRSTVLQLRGFDTTGEFLARQRKLIESQA